METNVRLVFFLLGIIFYYGTVSIEDKDIAKIIADLYKESGNLSEASPTEVDEAITDENDENSTLPYVSESEVDNATFYKRMLVQLFLTDIYETVHAACTGVIIFDDSIITSGTCMRDANEESMIKVCYDDVNHEPTTCRNSTYAIKIIFPANEWYNDLAFIKVNASELNATAAIAFWEKADVTDCIMYGVSMKNALVDIRVDVRRSCRYGYYCVDDPSGWSCDMSPGSMLVCAGAVRGIYVDKYSQSCRYHNDRESMAHHVDNSPGDERKVERIQMDHYPLLFFISFEQYTPLIDNVIKD